MYHHQVAVAMPQPEVTKFRLESLGHLLLDSDVVVPPRLARLAIWGMVAFPVLRRGFSFGTRSLQLV